LHPWIKGAIILKKYIWIASLTMLSTLLFVGCDTGTTTESSDTNSPDNQYQKSAGLTDEQAIANAKKLCEENALGGQDNVFNLNYTGSSLETD